MINIIYILLLMIVLHIIADYFLQGILAQFKQKSFWKNYPDYYQHDYIIALIEHAFLWSFIVLIPIFYYFFKDYMLACVILLGINTCIHAIIDHMKANVKIINLTTDQIIHFIQIFVTWIYAFFLLEPMNEIIFKYGVI